MSEGQDASGLYGVHGQMFNAEGTVSGTEFRVNTVTTDDCGGVAIAPLLNGRFVVVWRRTINVGVYAQIFAADGTKSGSEITVDQPALASLMTNQYIPAVSSFSDGSFVIVWNTNANELKAKIFNPNGSIKHTGWTVANTNVDYATFCSKMVTLSDQSMIIIYHGFASVSLDYEVYARKFDSAGTAIGSIFKVNSPAPGYQRRAKGMALPAPDGGFWVAFISYSGSNDDIYMKRYDSNKNAVTSEIRANQFISNYHQYPSLSLLPNNDFVVVWSSNGQSGTYDIYARIYNSAGVPYDGEFRVNTYTTADQLMPVVTSFKEGGFLVVWHSNGQDGSGYGIYAKAYRPTIAPSITMTGDTLVNTCYTNSQSSPAITSLANGGFVIVWQSSGQDLDGNGIFAQRYNSNGTANGAEFRVNTYTILDQGKPSVASLANDGFVIVWHSQNQDTSGYGIYGRMFDNDGAIGLEFRVNTVISGDQRNPTVAKLNDDGFVVVWQSFGQDGSDYGIYARRYNTAGVASIIEFKVNTVATNEQSNPAITSLTSGSFVIVWQSQGQDGNGFGIYGQIYTLAAVASGLEFPVNTFTAGDQSNPAVASLADGGFVVTWQSYAQDRSDFRIYGRRFNSGGTALALEFRINTRKSGRQSDPSISRLNGNGFIVTWQSYGQDGSDFGVYGQSFNPDFTVSGSEFRVNTITLNEQSSPVVTSLTNNYIVVSWQSYQQDSSDSGVFARMFCPFSYNNVCYPACPALAPKVRNHVCYEDNMDWVIALIYYQNQVTRALIAVSKTVSTGSSLYFLMSNWGSMYLYIRYLRINYPDKVEELFEAQDQELISLSINIDFPATLELDLPQRTLFEKYDVHSSFLYNFWESLTSFLIILVYTLLMMLIEYVTRKHHLKINSVSKYSILYEDYETHSFWSLAYILIVFFRDAIFNLI